GGREPPVREEVEQLRVQVATRAGKLLNNPGEVRRASQVTVLPQDFDQVDALLLELAELLEQAHWGNCSGWQAAEEEFSGRQGWQGQADGAGAPGGQLRSATPQIPAVTRARKLSR